MEKREDSLRSHSPKGEGFCFEVMEIRKRKVRVQARTEREALQRVRDAWYNTEIMLDESDFCGVEFIRVDDNDVQYMEVEK